VPVRACRNAGAADRDWDAHSRGGLLQLEDPFMPLLRLRETSLFYREIGEGEPLIVLHGGPGSDHTYLRCFEVLANTVRLVFVDQRGHGRSDSAQSESITFEALRRDIDELADALGLERFGLMGQSFGGYVALEYAVHNPQRLTRLLLVDTAARGLTVVERQLQMEQIVGRWPELETLLDEPWGGDDATVSQQASRFAPIFFRRFDPALAEAHYKDILWRANAARVGDWILNGWDIRPRLHAIHVPTLVLAGRHDIVIPCHLGRELAGLIAGARFEIFEESAHNAFLEEPELFFAKVRAWLRDTPIAA